MKVVLSGATGTVQRRFDLCSGESFHILYPPQSGYEAPPRPERPRGLPYCPGDPRCKKKKPVG